MFAFILRVRETITENNVVRYRLWGAEKINHDKNETNYTSSLVMFFYLL